MTFSLVRMARQQGRRRSIALRPINPTKAQADELARILLPAATIWREGLDRIMAAYTPPTRDGLTTDSPGAIQTTIDAIASEFLTRLVVSVAPALRGWAVRSERLHRNRWVAAIAAGVGVDLSTILTAGEVNETIEAFVARNVALGRNISDQAQGRIADAVFRGYQQRTPAREVAREIAEATNMGRKRALGIAADQNAKLSAALDRERQAEAGLEQYKWRHSGKLHPRAEHKARDGKLFDLDTPKGDQPGDAPWCGCRAQAWIALADEVSD